MYAMPGSAGARPDGSGCSVVRNLATDSAERLAAISQRKTSGTAEAGVFARAAGGRSAVESVHSAGFGLKSISTPKSELQDGAELIAGQKKAPAVTKLHAQLSNNSFSRFGKSAWFSARDDNLTRRASWSGLLLRDARDRGWCKHAHGE